MFVPSCHNKTIVICVSLMTCKIAMLGSIFEFNTRAVFPPPTTTTNSVVSTMLGGFFPSGAAGETEAAFSNQRLFSGKVSQPIPPISNPLTFCAESSKHLLQVVFVVQVVAFCCQNRLFFHESPNVISPVKRIFSFVFTKLFQHCKFTSLQSFSPPCASLGCPCPRVCFFFSFFRSSLTHVKLTSLQGFSPACVFSACPRWNTTRASGLL
jgi:hypothetical protein